MMRARTRDRASIQHATAWIVLVAITALLLLPVAAFAESLLVSEYKVPKEAAPGDDHSDGWYVSTENVLKDPLFTARTLRGADGSNGLAWSAVGEVDARVVGRGSSTDKRLTPFTSFEDFAARSREITPGEDYLFRAMSDPSLRIWEGAKRTTLGGLDAYVNHSTIRLEYEDGADAEYGETWVYWIPAGNDSGILVSAASAVTWSQAKPQTSGEHYGDQLGPMTAEVESVLASLKFYPLDGTSAGTGVPGPDGGGTSPWRTVTGGLAAVAAAAIALAGAAAKARTKTPDAEEPAPDQPVGYVLQLSSGQLTVSAEHSASFTAQAFKVLPDGTYRPASDAAVVLHVPPGVSVQPQTAYGTLQTTVWQSGELTPGAAITVEARASLGSTTASIPVTAAGVSRIVTRVEPSGVSLRTQGDDSLTLVAAVELLGADTEADPVAVRASLEFTEDSEWLEISAPADYEDGRAITVVASQPDPTSVVQPPESATVRVSAHIAERVLTELVTISLARLPQIDARPDSVTLAADSGTSTEVSIWIDNAGPSAWSFETQWREGARLLATPDIVATGSSTATLTITESAGDRIDPSRPQSASTLVVVASADGFDPIRREVQVIVTQEGLFVDRTNVDPSTGAFALKADGSATPAQIDLRVFVRDVTTGEIAPDIGLAQSAVLEIGGEEGTSGHAGLKAGGLTVQTVGIRPLNIPSATFSVSLERELPTGGEPLAATLRANIPGHDEDRFSAMVPLRLIGTNTDPFSDAWQIELDGCRDVIANFVPVEHRERLYALVNERSLTMGAEGLYKMRMGLWSFAHDQIMLEKHEHLDAAWWNEQIEGTLDWISWCGDIAMGVASGAYLGVVGSVAIGMLKPLLVSAMETWQRGGSLEDWLAAQAGMLTGMAEGSLTDPDFLSKLSGDKKAIGWALFIAYYFAKELYNDPNLSVTDAMKRVGAQLRDEGLIRFLQKIAGMKGMATSDAATSKAGADAGKPAGPDSTKPATPDAAKPTGPDAAKPATDAPSKQPDGPQKAVPEKPGAAADTPPADTSAAPKKPKGSPAERAATLANDLAAKTADGGKVDRATVERVLRDPDAMRELKKNRPDLWKKMHETRAEIYEGHDRKLEQWVRDNVPEADGKQIEVESFGTPDGVDRDYRVGYVSTDPVTGQRRFIELKKETWAAESHRIFAGETGGPTDAKGAAKWAKDHQQLATDQYHAEASVDMADQGTIYNEATGKWEKSQITPNVEMVKAGKSTLLDPDGLGKTYETKVSEAYHEGNVLDAYKQADKAVHSLEGVQDGYAKQGYGVKDPPPKVKAGMDVIKDVQSGKLTPEAAEAKLKDLKYDGLPDFMEKVSGQFASFKWVRKA